MSAPDPLNTTPWKVKKLPDESFAYLVPDAEIRTDGGKMCAKVIVSTETLDRERDILVARGCDTSDHRANPIVLLNHRRDWPGVAQSQDPTGNYTVKALDDRIEAVNWFNQSSKLALQTFRLVESGALRGVSPGFLTVPNHVHKVKWSDGHPAFRYDRWKLVEITHCPIGMNPDALVLAVEKGFGGESLLPELKEVLIPFVPEKKASVTGGWDTKSLDAVDAPAVADTDIDLSDAEAVPLTPSTQFYHAMWQKAFDAFSLARELGGIQEVSRTKADARRIESLFGGVMDTCLKGHAGHVNEYPDQPGLPGGPNEEIMQKLMPEWRTKALNKWDEYRRALEKDAVAAEYSEDVGDTIKFLTAIANDRAQRMQVRAVAKQMVGRLSNVKMVALPPDDDEELEWGKVAERLTKAGV